MDDAWCTKRVAWVTASIAAPASSVSDHSPVLSWVGTSFQKRRTFPEVSHPAYTLEEEDRCQRMSPPGPATA